MLAAITHPTSEARQFHHLDSCDEQAEGSGVIGETRRGIVPRPERQRRARRSRALIYNRDTTQHERCELRKSCPWSRNDEAPMKGPRRSGMIRPCRVGVGPLYGWRLVQQSAEQRLYPRQVGCNHVSSAFPFLYQTPPHPQGWPPLNGSTSARRWDGSVQRNRMAHQYRS